MRRSESRSPLPMTSAKDAPEHPGLPNPERLLAFLTLAMAIAMSVLDGTIVNVALPTMAHDLAISPADSIWIVNAFLLAVTVSLLPLLALLRRSSDRALATLRWWSRCARPPVRP
jgi:MFS family permease